VEACKKKINHFSLSKHQIWSFANFNGEKTLVEKGGGPPPNPPLYQKVDTFLCVKDEILSAFE
jgi:hypothetical protein